MSWWIGWLTEATGAMGTIGLGQFVRRLAGRKGGKLTRRCHEQPGKLPLQSWQCMALMTVRRRDRGIGGFSL